MIILYVALAILILLLMITVHELGHYVAGKILKFKINEFSIGFGPAIFKRKNKKTGEVFSVRWIPLGGYCAFEGEDAAGSAGAGKTNAKTKNAAASGDTSEKTVTAATAASALSDGAFNKQKAWKRLIVLSAGAIFNILFGFLTVILMLVIVGYGALNVHSVSGVNDSPTRLQAGDVIYKVEGHNLSIFKGLDYYLGNRAGKSIKITIKDQNGSNSSKVSAGIIDIREFKEDEGLAAELGLVIYGGVSSYTNGKQVGDIVNINIKYGGKDLLPVTAEVFDYNESVNGQTTTKLGLSVFDGDKLEQYIDVKKAGDEYSLQIKRGGKKQIITAELIDVVDQIGAKQAGDTVMLGVKFATETTAINVMGKIYEVADAAGDEGATKLVIGFADGAEEFLAGKAAGDTLVVAVKLEGETDEINVIAEMLTTLDGNLVAGIDGSEFEDFINGKKAFRTRLGIEQINHKYGFGEALGACFRVTFDIFWETLVAIFKLFTGQFALKDIGGPFGTINAIAKTSSQNIKIIFFLLPLITINLGLFNLLPLPALDGGRMVFVGIEMIRRKPVNPKIEAWIHGIGLILLLSFVLIIDFINLVLRR